MEAGLTKIDRAQLLDLLHGRLDIEELHELCFRLANRVPGLDFDSLRGQGKRSKTRELIRFMENRRHLAILMQELREMRPNLEDDVQTLLGPVEQGPGFGTVRETALDKKTKKVFEQDWAGAYDAIVTEVRRIMTWDKARQKDYAQTVVTLTRSPDENQRGIAGGILEELIEYDPVLVPVSDLVEIAENSQCFIVKTSISICFFRLACTSPGVVPVDTVVRLVLDGDWYVTTPALNTLKVLASTRPAAVAAFDMLAEHKDAGYRELVASALNHIVDHDPAVVPRDTLMKLSEDRHKATRLIAKEALEKWDDLGLSKQDIADAYTPYSPF
jgi:hypothetical protein